MIKPRVILLLVFYFYGLLKVKGENALSKFPGLAPSYSVAMSVNYPLLASESQEYQEIFKGDIKKARIKRWQGGQLTDIIIDYPQREVYKIVDTQCNAESINFNDPYNNASLSEIIDSKGYYSASHWTYTFVDNNPYASEMVYDQVEYENKMLDRFSVYNDVNFVEFYYTSNKWTGPRNDNAPVALNVYTNDTRELVFIINYYSYQDLPDVSDETFMTPIGMYCSGRKKGVKLPMLPDILTYSIESFNVQLGESLQWVFNSKVNYDKRHKLVSYDHHDKKIQPQPPFYEEGGLTVIHDFSSGVAYYIDDIYGNCSSLPMSNDFLDTKYSGNETKSWNLRMLEQREPSQLFNMDNSSFSFIGTRNVRGMEADHYLARRSDIHLPYYPESDLLIDLFFLNDRWAEVARSNGFDINTNIPVKMILTPYSKFLFPEYNYDEVYNFFNFDAESQEGFGDKPSWDFDVRRCYNDRQKKTFRIVLQGPIYSPFQPELVPVLSYNSLKVFRMFIGQTVSALRFQKLQIDFNETNVFLTATLLDTPPLTAQFFEVANMSWNPNAQTNKSFIVINTTSSFDCKQLCSVSDEILCQSAVFNKKTSQCILSNLHMKKSQLQTDINSIYFTRPVKIDHVEMSLEKAFNIIKEAVESKAFCVDIEMDESGDQTATYCGVQFIPNVFGSGSDTDSLWPLVGRHLAQFTVKENWQVPAMRLVEGNILADECARICLNDPSHPPCEAFNYNFKIGECMISKTGVAGSYSTEVNYYTKNVLARYNQYPGKTIRGDSNQAKVISSPTECAKLCDSTKDLNCRSFDICESPSHLDEYLCYLNTEHMTDKNVNSKEEVTCDHYSRGYTIDFKTLYRNMKMKLDNFVEYDSENEDECSKLCVEKYSEDCKGYFLCPNGESTKCGIVQADQTPINHKKGNLTCSYMERLYNTDGSTYSTNLKTVTKTEGLSTGGAVGLAFGMLLLGAILPLSVLIFVLMKKKKTDDQMDLQVYFHKEQQSS